MQPQQAQANKKRGGSIHDHIMQMEPVTDRLLRWLPEWVRDVVQDRRRHLLYVERQMQRRLVNEFRAQVRELEPVLRTRGRMVGEVLIDTVTGSGETEMTYAEIVSQSLRHTVADRLPVRELVTVMDPLLTPFISPFVDGIKEPINEKAAELRESIVTGFMATAAASVATGLVAGFLLGRYLPKGGDSGGSGSSSGGGGRR